MGRSRLTKLAALFGFVALGVSLAFAWTAREVSIAAAGISTVLTAFTVAVLAWWVIDDWRLRREALTDRRPLDHPPSDHRPIEVARLVLTRGRGARSGFGATLLMLAHERTIELDGLDSERYVLKVPAGARGRTDGEDEILVELRERVGAGADVEIVGPPMPKLDFDERDARVIADVHQRLIQDGTLRLRAWGLPALPPLVIVPNHHAECRLAARARAPRRCRACARDARRRRRLRAHLHASRPRAPSQLAGVRSLAARPQRARAGRRARRRDLG